MLSLATGPGQSSKPILVGPAGLAESAPHSDTIFINLKPKPWHLGAPWLWTTDPWLPVSENLRAKRSEKPRRVYEERAIPGCGTCKGHACILHPAVLTFCSSGTWIFRAFFMMGWGLSSSSEKRCLRGSKVSWPGMLDRAKSAGSGSNVISTSTVSGSTGLGVSREVRP